MKHVLFICLFFIGNYITISQVVSVESNDIKTQETPVFKFHPNPAESDLFIIGTNKIKIVEIIDILGKRVALYQFDKSIIKLNVSELNSGMYLLRAIDKYDQQETKQLIVK